ncbi:hypothetical protein AB1Y20_018091 [Prymnesium parvum]|uniref:RRM domain-containing protein n=1 Tax=Prymnesium parvum TaxID=97485 RepID=A0AB34JNN1_PRYPA
MSAEGSGAPTVDSLYAADVTLQMGPSETAYTTLLSGASPSAAVAARQLAATLLRKHSPGYARRTDESCAALLALCADAELKVRLTAISALPALLSPASSLDAAAVHGTMRRVVAAMEALLLSKNALEARTVQGSLGELAAQHALPLLLAALELGLSPQAGGEEEAAEGEPQGRRLWPPALGRYFRTNVEQLELMIAAAAREPAGGAAPSDAAALRGALGAEALRSIHPADVRVAERMVAALDVQEERGQPAAAVAQQDASQPAERALPKAAAKKEERPPSRVLYVGGLPAAMTTSESLAKELSRWGEIDVIKPFSKVGQGNRATSQQGRCFAFVSMKEQRDAEQAVAAFVAGQYRPFNDPHARLNFADRLPKGTLSNGILFQGTLSNRTLSKRTLSKRTLPKRTFPEGILSKETLSKGILSEGTLPKRTFPKGILSKETLSKGILSKGTLSKGILSKGTLSKRAGGCGDRKEAAAPHSPPRAREASPPRGRGEASPASSRGAAPRGAPQPRNPPSKGVFVSHLSNEVERQQLEARLTAEFNRYGPVHSVRIFEPRQRGQVRAAFVNFFEVTHAVEAVDALRHAYKLDYCKREGATASRAEGELKTPHEAMRRGEPPPRGMAEPPHDAMRRGGGELPPRGMGEPPHDAMRRGEPPPRGMGEPLPPRGMGEPPHDAMRRGEPPPPRGMGEPLPPRGMGEPPHDAMRRGEPPPPRGMGESLPPRGMGEPPHDAMRRGQWEPPPRGMVAPQHEAMRRGWEAPPGGMGGPPHDAMRRGGWEAPPGGKGGPPHDAIRRGWEPPPRGVGVPPHDAMRRGGWEAPQGAGWRGEGPPPPRGVWVESGRRRGWEGGGGAPRWVDAAGVPLDRMEPRRAPPPADGRWAAGKGAPSGEWRPPPPRAGGGFGAEREGGRGVRSQQSPRGMRREASQEERTSLCSGSPPSFHASRPPSSRHRSSPSYSPPPRDRSGPRRDHPSIERRPDSPARGAKRPLPDSERSFPPARAPRLGEGERRLPPPHMAPPDRRGAPPPHNRPVEREWRADFAPRGFRSPPRERNGWHPRDGARGGMDGPPPFAGRQQGGMDRPPYARAPPPGPRDQRSPRFDRDRDRSPGGF